MISRLSLLAFALTAAASGAGFAQTAAAPVDPLQRAQDAFGAIVGGAFHAPDQIAAAVTPTASATLAPPLGGILRTSLQIPGAAFVALMAPFDSDAAVKAAPAPTAPAASRPRHRRHREPT